VCSIESDDRVGNATELRNVRLRLTQEKSVRLPDLCNNAVGIGLIVTSTFEAGVELFKRNKERSAITGRTVNTRMRRNPSLVIRK
jgi:hypothetical protein